MWAQAAQANVASSGTGQCGLQRHRPMWPPAAQAAAARQAGTCIASRGRRGGGGCVARRAPKGDGDRDGVHLQEAGTRVLMRCPGVQMSGSAPAGSCLQVSSQLHTHGGAIPDQGQVEGVGFRAVLSVGFLAGSRTHSGAALARKCPRPPSPASRARACAQVPQATVTRKPCVRVCASARVAAPSRVTARMCVGLGWECRWGPWRAKP